MKKLFKFAVAVVLISSSVFAQAKEFQLVQMKKSLLWEISGKD
jgi:hypothetical protein